MVEINGKQICENCFEETTTPVCPHCGYNSAAGTGDSTMLKPGSILLGKYIVGKVMGKGGFGVTYLAYDVTAGRKVAIKEFFPYGVALRASGTTTVSVASADNAEAFKLGAEKFYNEAKLVSRFNRNPNIVGVYEFFYENDTVYFAMEYLKGRTLKEYIGEHGVLTAPQALFVAQNVANALEAAHGANVLHRDISPDNIIICDNGDVKLIDFGAARQVVAEHSQSFSVILKPGFAPLEQYQKKGNQGPWTDIYSLGATIYYTLTTDIPEDPMSRFDGDEAYSSNQYHIDPELWDVISKATELKIEKRYSDVFQLKSDLAEISFAAEPLFVSEEQSAGLSGFQTAKPLGMTQAASDTVGMTVSAANTQAAPKKKHTAGIIAGICGGVAAVAAAVIIIPIALKSNRGDGGSYISNDYSTTQTNESSGNSESPGSPESSSTFSFVISTPLPQIVTDKAYTDVNGNEMTYTGEWLNDKPNGQGTASYSKGSVYEGEWKDGLPSGQGEYTFADGRVYTGEWKDGVKNGQGVFTWTDGNTYTGEFKNDKMNGHGKYTWASGQVHIGEFKDGNRHGEGYTYMIRSGDATSWIRSGTYTDGKFTSGGLLAIKGNEYDFKFGDYDSDGELSGTDCYTEVRDSSGKITYWKGTMENAALVQGEKMIINADNTYIFAGTWDPESKKIKNAYGIKFDMSGNVTNAWKYTDGVEKAISVSEAAKISELQKYNAQYISNAVSTHYGYKEIFLKMSADFRAVGGPAIK